MADYLVTDTELTSVADAIRTKGGTSANLSFPTGFVSAINAIISNAVLGSKTITSNGTYDPRDDSLDGYSSVTVNVAGTNISPFTHFKTGTITKGNVTSNTVITTVSDLGFEPTVFALYRTDNTTTANTILMAFTYMFDKTNGTQWRVTVKRGSSATALSLAGMGYAQASRSTQSSGTLRISSTNIDIYAISSCALWGTYRWVALA